MPAKKPPPDFSTRVNLLITSVVALLGMATLAAAALQLSARIPVSPWEASLMMEGVRFARHLPVYESAHATHLYGPLLTVLFAGVYDIFGISFAAARIVIAIFGLAVALVLALICCRGRKRACFLFGIVLFLALNFRTNLVLFSTQPDGVAAFFAVCGIYFWATARESRVRAALAIVLLVCGMLFKQTAAAFSLIPLFYVVFWQRPIRGRAFAASAVPLAAICVALATIRVVSPEMFSAVIIVPASLKVYPERALTILLYVLATFPLFLIALASVSRWRITLDDRDRWIVSAVIVLVPISAWTMAKAGGDYNSLLYGYLAMTALFVSQWENISAWLGSLTRTRYLGASVVIAIAILFSFCAQLDRISTLLFARHGDEKYETAVAAARRIGPGVVSPQDPTIAFRATGYIGRSLFFELDGHSVNGNWPADIPASVAQELSTARSVVEVRSFVPTPMFGTALARNGFHEVSVPELQNSAYRIWQR